MRKRVTNEAYIKKASLKHNNFYTYENTTYTKAIEKISITCPIHGIFIQVASDHLRGSGCTPCGKISSINKLNKTKEQFLTEANNKHNNKFKYNLLNYINTNSKIEIICPVHGSFKQTAMTHLKPAGCRKCNTDKQRDTTESFIEKAKKIHNETYDYSLVKYIHTKHKIKIICKTHGTFEQTPNHHLNGKGCVHCKHHSFSKSGFKEQAKDRICTFYIIKCWNDTETFYKIGITSISVKKRYPNRRSMPYTFEIIKEVCSEAETIWTIENNLKKELSSNYTPNIVFAGSTRECYTDINEIHKALDRF